MRYSFTRVTLDLLLSNLTNDPTIPSSFRLHDGTMYELIKSKGRLTFWRCNDPIQHETHEGSVTWWMSRSEVNEEKTFRFFSIYYAVKSTYTSWLWFIPCEIVSSQTTTFNELVAYRIISSSKLLSLLCIHGNWFNWFKWNAGQHSQFLKQFISKKFFCNNSCTTILN